MTVLLASVLSADEAELAIRAGVYIVDLKDPGQGALGAAHMPFQLGQFVI